MADAPRIGGVLETALYVDDMARAVAFYDSLFRLPHLFDSDRLVALDAGPRSVLLLFKRGGSLDAQTTPGGVIPPHDGGGPLHVALAIEAGSTAAWEKRLDERGVPVEGRTDWPRGGISLYLRDPDGHLLELATPGLWASY